MLTGTACSSEGDKETKTENEQAESTANNDEPSEPVDESLAKIKLPDGFKIDYYAKNVENARSMALSPSGVLFVGTRSNDKVFAIVDKDKDGKADETITIASGLNSPNGVALKDGDLYVAEISRIIKFPKIEQNMRNNPKYEVVYDKYPSDTHHGWKYIAFGPDGKLYVPVGAPCNVCKEENPVYATITRLNADGTGMEIFAEGVRNTVGFTWHPESKELWFTDNGRDMLGDNIPNDELNLATKQGQHFGFPYCHEGEIPDPEFGKNRDCSEFVKPVQKLGPHVASLGLKFYNGNMFPEQYKNQLFIAQHGSWNRSEPIGYRVMQLAVDGKGNASNYKTFAEGWLQNGKAWGRPVDVVVMEDGALLVSDDTNNAIYRISYQK
ncbi:sorbosone dehydrogenase family protein [Pontibacter sp. BT310]|uniref:Sorbosone dehydrogenase family protein n=2 Tax=Hymenobacteraceae TaxID=1853232 RepID=A0ABS6XEE3_9BACT|nr:sorbosone dehydrogenase family protein [Pontibacter sp. BT310]MBR0571825.1 sorbosone dehydrogenase family protein [Microvirga sp. STS03]MBW3366251.1 sorbosone dehydrogenase family protein [Pontibacter populi]